MKLLIRRLHFRDTCTIGKLFIDDVDARIYTLEDAVREKKIPGETAIPAGAYNVIVDYSEHFKRPLPHILGVPGFEGVRIHSGNDAADTEGCILVGKEWDHGLRIARSRDAFSELFPLIQAAKEVILEIA